MSYSRKGESLGCVARAAYSGYLKRVHVGDYPECVAVAWDRAADAVVSMVLAAVREELAPTLRTEVECSKRSRKRRMQ